MRLLASFLAKMCEFWHQYVSPALPHACRFEPSCSLYAAQALRTHGLIHGSWLAFRRVIRCHPWGPWGPDPVPPRFASLRTKEGNP